MANALVCLHASAGSGRQWSTLAAGLGRRYTLNAPDLGGAASREPPQRLGELLGAALPQMVRYTLPAVGHMGPVTHAELVNSLVKGFVDAQRPRPSAVAWRKAA